MALLQNTLGDGFVIGAHEAAHARDALVSQKMKGFEKAHPDKAYNLHSAKVLADAKRSLGLKVSDRKYIDYLTQIFGSSTKLYGRFKDSPKEIIAYAIDYEASTEGNELSHAIAERFGKC